MSQSLHEAIMQVAGVQQKQETNIDRSSDNLVYEYLSAFFGVDLNESYDDLTEENFEDAILTVNAIRDAVNEYFEVNEAVKPYPTIEKLPAGHVRTDMSGRHTTSSLMVNPKSGQKEVVHHGPEDKVREQEKAIAADIERSTGPRRNNRRAY
jgi:hypothetical protein